MTSSRRADGTTRPLLVTGAAVVVAGWICWLGAVGRCGAQPPAEPASGVEQKACRVVADQRLEEPLRAIAAEYRRHTGESVVIEFLPVGRIEALLKQQTAGYDAALCMAAEAGGDTWLAARPEAKRVAWKYPSFEPVWVVVLTEHPRAAAWVRFVGGPIGHRLWSESEAGFTITPDASARSYEWVVEHRVKQTYPATAARMLAECGGLRDGVCIDLGCGSGQLDVELAQRSRFRIIGLDIDPEMKPLFEQRIRAAGLQDRVSFVVGDAQQLPFPDDHADVIVSRGALIFIPDIKACLREVDRVLKPTGIAFLGGRYVYTPRVHKISTDALREIARESGVPGIQVIDARGQWVKIIGPQAPAEAPTFQGGPHMLAHRLVADYGITQGRCLLICGNDGEAQRALQEALVGVTELEITALYASGQVTAEAQQRIQDSPRADRFQCVTGDIESLPFEAASFDLIAGAGPMLLFAKDKERAMRELHRLLRPGGVALIGGRFLHMPASRRVPSATLREIAARSGIPTVQVQDDMGQWVEIRKPR